MGDSRRLGYIEVIRVIAMLMIVALHCICYYTGKWGGYGERPRIELYDGVSVFCMVLRCPCSRVYRVSFMRYSESVVSMPTMAGLLLAR